MVDEDQTCLFQSQWGVMPVRKSFFVGAARAELDLRQPVAVVCPTTIIHGMHDDTVNYRDSIKLMLQVNTKRVNLVLRKDSGHRMTNK
jgi:esterase/lipase